MPYTSQSIRNVNIWPVYMSQDTQTRNGTLQNNIGHSMPQDVLNAPKESKLSLIPAEDAHSALRESDLLRELALSHEATTSSCSYERSCNAELPEASEQRL
ncbi:hypothetical protein OnM2_061034 [Erysiphe neolycopersici]|uniref:Uncharacterized protein n=1 Tax=Erysiphe neolycopersici TaxID=212602 RepID=A0A420HP66_9PEZI|nr:hypothetical protein OnM2_061034 [Erysiphe neolycopersici]